MSKRAVEISYELLKDWLTQGNMIESIEVIKGLPEDAYCVEMFPRPTLNPSIVMVFESDNWEGESKYFADCPICGKVPYQDVILENHFRKDGYTKVLEVGYDQSRFIVHSKMPITIKEGRLNNEYTTVWGNPLTHIDSSEWIEMEELT